MADPNDRDRYSPYLFDVDTDPDSWVQANGKGEGVVTVGVWRRGNFSIGGVKIIGRAAWHAGAPIWSKRVAYYNTRLLPLRSVLTTVVVHHTGNSASVRENERKQQQRSYAALGYHFFIDRAGSVYEGRPIEVMGSHAGEGLVSGPLNDPDCAAIGIVLQGNFERSLVPPDEPTMRQLDTLELLVRGLQRSYEIRRLMPHLAVLRSGKPTECPGERLLPRIEELRVRLGLSR